MPVFFKGYPDIRRALLLGIIPLILFGILGAGSMRMEEKEIEVTGRVYIMGNEPFTQAAIQLDDGKVYVLAGEHEKELRNVQGKRLTVKGHLSGKTTRGAEAIEVQSYEIQEQK